MEEKYIVADTNVWYYLAKKNNEKLNNLFRRIGKLCSIPLNLLEIAYKINEENFERQKVVVNIILKKTKIYLPHSSIFLKQSWGFKCDDEYDWKEGYKGIARAKSYHDLIDGYKDYLDLVIRKFNAPSARELKKLFCGFFYSEIIKAVDSIVPGYGEQIKNKGQPPKLKDKKKLALFDDDNFIYTIILTTWDRLKNFEEENGISIDARPSSDAFLTAESNLIIFAKAYAEYLRYLSQEGAKPEENDIGDIECFLYLRNDNYILATAEKRWIRIGKKVCPEKILDIRDYI
jgi:hypothetical protein